MVGRGLPFSRYGGVHTCNMQQLQWGYMSLFGQVQSLSEWHPLLGTDLLGSGYLVCDKALTGQEELIECVCAANEIACAGHLLCVACSTAVKLQRVSQHREPQ